GMLEGLEAVRKRPGMYIGSTGERGLHHLIWEVVDNAVDEAMAGHATKVRVRLLADGGVEVSDDGRGIPVEMHESGVPTVDVVMTQVGVSVVNALSTRMEVEICRDGYQWFQTYDKSVPGTLKQGEKTRKTGTVVRFWPDPDVFETTTFDFETVARRLQEQAFLNKGLTIELIDERDGKHRTFYYPG
uniref:DNA gyrase subunit B n=1 Tax=Mycolicibacterium thermoresistibile TaxID=1797 RepID=UPI0015F35214|nr:Chain A, DNA gyrase subunit B [Mycolicibacterium thermoresistibile]6Y8L_B Chain B, DNA gyrase subunit B [Mycolicibacterium thermoresistibile]6Y8N_A Chain A, DNA gyrase subunit B [Mycolicibacterium thermoresistibile]6Y8N_B Chain B, DNA gyrase subunit B [Mycolicibacterium thermoresistibile]